jgi:predicted phosphodiesterase
VDITKALAATQPEPATQPRRHERTTGREFEWDGSAGWLRTEPLEDRPKTWDEFILDAGLDPNEVEVVEPVQVRGWDMPKREDDDTTSLVRAHYYRLTLVRRGLRADIDELVKAAKARYKQKSPAVTNADIAFVVALGDLQLGKADGDGVEGTVARFLETTKAAVARYKRAAKGSPVYLIHLGDCIEGYVSQGGANAWRTTLTTTEQVRLYRRLLTEQVKAFAAVAPELVMCGVPGNHDEAHRPLHTYGDSWAIDAVAAVRDACELAGNYDHVKFHAPARDELTLTLDVCGTRIGMAHGHQFGNGAEGWKKWWQGQGHGRQPIGDADVLIAAHRHHLAVNDSGGRTFIQVPALESESTWWRHKTGETGRPGIVTMLVGGGGWSGLEVLTA